MADGICIIGHCFHGSFICWCAIDLDNIDNCTVSVLYCCGTSQMSYGLRLANVIITHNSWKDQARCLEQDQNTFSLLNNDKHTGTCQQLKWAAAFA